MRPSIAVATISLARTPAEEEILFDSLGRLAHAGMPVVVSDGGSPERFVDALEKLPGVSVLRYQPHDGPRLLTQVQRAFHAADHAQWILYTEPDKSWFFEHALAEFAGATDRAEDADVIVAARDEASFRTFPAGQQLTESLFNQLCGSALERPGDYLYGPLLVRAGLVLYLLELREDVGWGWRPYLMAIARRQGRDVRIWTSHLPCPEAQRGEDDLGSRIYRMEQMAQNVKGLALGLKTG